MTLLDTAAFLAHESRWDDPAYTLCIAATPPNQECTARRQIMRHDMAVFLPECLDDQQRIVEFPTGRIGRVKRQSRALYPGYIFLALDLARDPVVLIGELTIARLQRRGSKPIEPPRDHLTTLRGIAKAWEPNPIRVRRYINGGIEKFEVVEMPPKPGQNAYRIGDQVTAIRGVAQFVGAVEREAKNAITALVLNGMRVTAPKRFVGASYCRPDADTYRPIGPVCQQEKPF